MCARSLSDPIPAPVGEEDVVEPLGERVWSVVRDVSRMTAKGFLPKGLAPPPRVELAVARCAELVDGRGSGVVAWIDVGVGCRQVGFEPGVADVAVLGDDLVRYRLRLGVEVAEGEDEGDLSGVDRVPDRFGDLPGLGESVGEVEVPIGWMVRCV